MNFNFKLTYKFMNQITNCIHLISVNSHLLICKADSGDITTTLYLITKY